jgi:hypothetical protein
MAGPGIRLGLPLFSPFSCPSFPLFSKFDRWASLTILPRFRPKSCAILPQPSPDLNFATMESKLWPEALANKFAVSKSPKPSLVADFCACSVLHGNARLARNSGQDVCAARRIRMICVAFSLVRSFCSPLVHICINYFFFCHWTEKTCVITRSAGRSVARY